MLMICFDLVLIHFSFTQKRLFFVICLVGGVCLCQLPLNLSQDILDW